MKKIIFFILILNGVRGDWVKAQTNIVPNPSFENFYNLNANGTYLESFIYSWYGGFGYYNTNRSDSYYGVPANGVGYQYALTGNAYCGIYTYLKNSYPIRQYIQTKLSVTLLQGKRYKVSFYVSLSDTMHAFNNSLGAYFATDSLFTINNYVIDEIPQIVNPTANELNNKTDWTLVCDTFVATGDERWITIGNFLNDSLSLITPLDSVCDQPFHYNCGAYYYIDDVSVTLIDETGIEEQRQSEFSLFPNPNNGSFSLKYAGIITKPFILSITDVCGKLIDNLEITNTTTNYENTSLMNGLYFYSLRNGDEEVGRGKILVVK